ncbi:MAG TPA: hemolysin family protein [Hyphomicrobiaceae bacterium]|nr:hemolysin family protein [Hyphomicrobiaceae bacterium]
MLEIIIVLLLVLLNGLFALSELAVVSARRSRLTALAAEGRKGAQAALVLAADPGRLLSTVQIGITAVGLIAGAYSGANLTDDLAQYLVHKGVPASAAETLAYIGVFSLITYLSLIVGELVPKNLALRHAEQIACVVAPLMTTLSRIAAPAVWLLDVSTRAVFWLLGQRQPLKSTVTEEEIRGLIAEAEGAGVLESGERLLISGVLRLGDRPVRGLMTPRTEVDWIDVNADAEEVKQRLLKSPHTRLPVGDGSADDLIGVVRAPELLVAMVSGAPLNVRAHLRQAPIIPDTMDALDVLETLRDAQVPMALIHDEYGHFEGIVTPADVLAAIAGVFKSDLEAEEEPHATQRDDGSWLLAGAMPADEMAEQLGFTLPEKRDYQTLAGFILAELRRLPSVGEFMEAHGWRFEVVDLDGRRIDKVLASRIPASRRQLG